MRNVATSIAEEVADLASALEGGANDLVRTAPDRLRLPRAAQRFLALVQRLRALHGKLVAFGEVSPPVVAGTADLGEVVRSLRDELQHLRLALELEAELSPGLPSIAARPEVVRNALLFACSAMFRAEPGATHLTISAERGFTRSDPELRGELVLEWVSEPAGGRPPGNAGTALALEAARRLVESHGGHVTMTRLPGRAIRTAGAGGESVLWDDRGTPEVEDRDTIADSAYEIR